MEAVALPLYLEAWMKKIDDDSEIQRFTGDNPKPSKKRASKKKETPNEEPVTALPEEELPADGTGITVAAFMLNDENAATALEFGSGGVNDQTVRNEILKAIQEEGEK